MGPLSAQELKGTALVDQFGAEKPRGAAARVRTATARKTYEAHV